MNSKILKTFLVQDCDKEVADSYLLRTFDLSVCDSCRDTEKARITNAPLKLDVIHPRKGVIHGNSDLTTLHWPHFQDGKHELITKTDAKSTFLLTDYDMDKREPILKFILRKNPHNPRWGDMKLFLRQETILIRPEICCSFLRLMPFIFERAANFRA